MKSKTDSNKKSTISKANSTRPSHSRDSKHKKTFAHPYKPIKQTINPIDPTLKSTTIDKRINEYSINNPHVESEEEEEDSQSEGDITDTQAKQQSIKDKADLIDTNDIFTTRFCNSITTTSLDIAIASVKYTPTITQLSTPLLDTTIKLTSYPQLIDTLSDTDSYSNEIKEFTSLEALNIKQRLINPFTSANPIITGQQKQILPLMNTYKDMLYQSQTHENTKELRQVYCLHALNYCYKTRDRILKNSLKIKQDTLAMKESLEVRDQGFTRPRVLILTPFRNDAKEIIETIIQLSGTTMLENKKRFDDEFGIEEEDDIIDTKKSKDFQETFKGNIDDCFRIGLRFARKNLKLFSDFYSSDILVCSPLGLRMIIGAQGDKKRDFDFLSSIEVVILDKTNVFLMQNWEHVQHIFDHLNLIPKEQHDTDFSRIKSWYLDGKAKFLRQTLIFSFYTTPLINALANTQSNITGKSTVSKQHPGTLSQITKVVPQLFQRLSTPSPDTRFKEFSKIVEKFDGVKGVIVFVPSYFDYVKLRNYLTSIKSDFVGLNEYSTNVDISRARLRFFKNEIGILLTTERLHFFKRYIFRGARHVVFYQVPENAAFYGEIVNGVDVEGAEKSGEGCSITLLYNMRDLIGIERVLGSKRAVEVVGSKSDVTVFTA